MSISQTTHHVIVFALAALAAGCGGGDDTGSLSGAQASPAAAVSGYSGTNGSTARADSRAAQASRDQRVAALPLFDDLGRPVLTPPKLQPTDAAARTRNGLYATQAQYEWQELIAGPYTVLIDVDKLGSAEAAMLAAAQSHDLRAMDPSPDRQALAYFVRARQPAQAAAVVDRMAEAGFDAVFLLH